ncbi:MAG TPA: hypothetical protein VL095_00745 [Flavisolibacter sp.]|nr:hypothetical protein [Flavisolibacter sp.]
MTSPRRDIIIMDEIILQEDYLRPLPTSHKINPTTKTTRRIPTHMPALKIPPTTSQDDKVIAIAKAKSPNTEYCFMSSSFREDNANALPKEGLPILIAIGTSGGGTSLQHRPT